VQLKNHELCEELLADIERRGLKLTKRIIWVTDGGKGIGKALRGRFGRKLIHQRCTIHKDRNIQKHLARRYIKEAHCRFTVALQQNNYEDARQMLLDMEKWLRSINRVGSGFSFRGNGGYTHSSPAKSSSIAEEDIAFNQSYREYVLNGEGWGG